MTSIFLQYQITDPGLDPLLLDWVTSAHGLRDWFLHHWVVLCTQTGTLKLYPVNVEYLPRHFLSLNAAAMPRRSRMRPGWIKGSLVVLAVATALLYLSSIRREVHAHSERLQRAHHNDSVRGQGMLQRVAQMEADINRLGESNSSIHCNQSYISLRYLCICFTFHIVQQ